MRAAVCHRYGPPEVVALEELPTPALGSGELLIRVRATTVNRTDCGYRAGAPAAIRLVAGLRRPRRPVLGTEFAGEVEATGPGCHRFAVGDHLFGYVEGRFGAHAQQLVVAEDGSVARIPAGIGHQLAAPATEGAHYALAFIRVTGVGAGDAVLVNGATGAIGSAAVQLLAHLGASVVAVCHGDHAELVAGLGAHRVIDHTTTDPTTDRQRFDAVFDAVGLSSFDRCRHLLHPGGVYCSSELGRRAVNLPLSAVGTLTSRRRRVVFPLPRHDRAMVEHLADLMASGAYRPVIDRHYPLEQIVDAYHHAESGTKIGNLVIDVP